MNPYLHLISSLKTKSLKLTIVIVHSNNTQSGTIGHYVTAMHHNGNSGEL